MVPGGAHTTVGAKAESGGYVDQRGDTGPVRWRWVRGCVPGQCEQPHLPRSKLPVLQLQELHQGVQQ